MYQKSLLLLLELSLTYLQWKIQFSKKLFRAITFDWSVLRRRGQRSWATFSKLFSEIPHLLAYRFCISGYRSQVARWRVARKNDRKVGYACHVVALFFVWNLRQKLRFQDVNQHKHKRSFWLNTLTIQIRSKKPFLHLSSKPSHDQKPFPQKAQASNLHWWDHFHLHSIVLEKQNKSSNSKMFV